MSNNLNLYSFFLSLIKLIDIAAVSVYVYSVYNFLSFTEEVNSLIDVRLLQIILLTSALVLIGCLTIFKIERLIKSSIGSTTFIYIGCILNILSSIYLNYIVINSISLTIINCVFCGYIILITNSVEKEKL